MDDEAGTPETALYVHWPFCVKKCPYCDFNSHLRGARDDKAFADAIAAEIRFAAKQYERTPRIKSIFFGGGTPSLMSGEAVAQILEAARDGFGLRSDCEITLEANPSSAERKKIAAFKRAGVNRLSIGVQSFKDDTLRFLGRAHNADEGLRAIETARHEFDHVSFDLIYALPDQNLETWRRELEYAISLGTEHLSLYQLTLEPKTLFASLAKQGKLHLPPARLKADFYRLTEDIMERNGFRAYEISNYAKPGAESRHNLAYWRYEPYLGVGPGAHGRVFDRGRVLAQKRHSGPDKWLKTVQDGGFKLETDQALNRDDMALEAILMGLRMRDGTDKTAFARKIGRRIGNYLNAVMLHACIEEGYLVDAPDTLRATFEGRLRLEAILEKILIF